MRLSLTLAALRNYVRPVFVRENHLVPSCGIFIGVLALQFGHEQRFVSAHGVAAVFHHGFSGFMMLWWMLALFAPSCVTIQYWRQITTGLAVAVPGMIEAEYRAVLIALAAVPLILASPLIALGAPVLGSLAVAALGMVGGMGSSRSRGQSRRTSIVLALLMLPLYLLAFLPRALGSILLAPWWLTFPLLIASVAAINVGLRFFPALARKQLESAEKATEWRTPGSASAAPRRGALAAIGGLLRWQPRSWQQEPLPGTLVMSLGPAGWMISLATLVGLIAAIGTATRLSQETLTHALHRSAVQALAQPPMVLMFSTRGWLMSRGEWPFLYLGGRHGPRLGFARALFRAHRRNALQIAASAGLVGALTLALLVRMKLGPAALGGVAIAALTFGLTYMTAVPLFWRELGGRRMNVALGLLAAFAGMMAVATGLTTHGLQSWLLPAALGMAVLGIAMEPAAVRRLALIDWPLEPEPADALFRPAPRPGA